MSTQDMETPRPKKDKKSKDESEKKSSSKKRRREEQDATSTQAPADTPTTSKVASIKVDDGSSPTKKQRTTDPSSAVKKSKLNSFETLQSALSAKASSHTPFAHQTSALYLPLAPAANLSPIQGLCLEHVSPLLLTYYPPLDGILLGYDNPRMSESARRDPGPISRPKKSVTNGDYDTGGDADEELEDAGDDAPLVMARCVDEYGAAHVWLFADFLLLRPEKERVVDGQVRVQNQSYLGLVLWNYFNASIERKRLPKDWKWSTGTKKSGQDEGEEVVEIEDEEEEYATDGFWIDGSGKKVEGKVWFTITDFEAAAPSDRDRGFVNILGTLLSDEDDRKLDQEALEKSRELLKGRR